MRCDHGIALRDACRACARVSTHDQRIREAELAVLEATERRLATKEAKMQAGCVGEEAFWKADDAHRAAVRAEDAAVRALRDARSGK